ncbi:small-conductance mechanosensitive channel [Terriglobus roseus DSM 18391]|uniref:Small-conductance mechanosensitive channel n=1 Tax=Terriglobus roseus (strain DSM 18391 / NRRL B-41598 / KBS 63) TaxID=926566 RepID=I3ZLU9_TERRK|nr:mechanosensitive ion channel domain-containing protein [Terriglobus roseus]AFL90217.1 small-conductance mechanosensitive channel [Terriglobus roseus DSM 18391]
MQVFNVWHGWFVPFFLLCAALAFSNAIHWVLFRVVHRRQESASQPGGFTPGLGLQRHLGKPSRAIFITTCLFLVLPFVPAAQRIQENVREVLALVMVCSMGWFAVGAVYVLQGVLYRRYDINAENNVDARRFRTQFQLLRRIVVAFIIVVTLAACAYTFHDDRLWRAGTGLLASAGLASLILASAAKSTVGNFLAGMQIALTQPIRIDDVVVVNGEWGRVEEINSAYVVIKIWDLRRLIVPLSWFIENSFTNWTRDSSDILGTAFLYLDYSVPVEPLRQKLLEIARSTRQWDGNVCGLQVTDLREHTMELRCLMSARNSSESFDLRCIVREEMMKFVRENYPDAFPTARFVAQAKDTPPVAAM